MSFFSTAYNWLTGWATRQSKGLQRPVPSSVAYDDIQSVGLDAAMQVSTVWACVKLLAETISSLPLFLYRSDDNGQRTLARDDDLYRVLHDMPNRRQTAQEFWEYMLVNLFLRGNCYARIRRNSQGRVVALWPLSADQIEVKVLDDGSVAYLYSVDSMRVIFPEAEILHIRGMGNDVVGMSPLDYMRASVSLALRTQSHLNKTYNKNARRPGILMRDSVLTDQQRIALKKTFGDIATGGEKELYVLEAGFKYEPLGMTPADLQLLESMRNSVEDLCRWFGVPSVLVNDTSKTTTWGTGVEQIIEGFYKFTIRPQVERIEQALQRRVLSPGQRASGMVVEFSLDALLRSSLKDRMEIYAKAVQNGIYTRNECRQYENMPPKDGGDELTAQVNLRPVDMLRTLTNGSNANVAQEPTSQ